MKQNSPNATCVQNTQNTPSVEILFGLTPAQITHSFGRYFGCDRMCSVALIEMIEAIQRGFDADNDMSTLVTCISTMKIMVSLEHLCVSYYKVSSVLHKYYNDPQWLTSSKCNEKNPELYNAVMSLHYGLTDIVAEIDKMGFNAFSINAAECFASVNTKQAYDDIVCAFSCICSIYIDYTKNLYASQLGALKN